ncbi:MiaB/RimO family radical SAM methylthiotransferase, partial [Paenibacillus sp. MCAF20]
ESTADVYLINTCTVTNTGDKKSRQIIRRAVRRNPDAVIAVTGCYAQTSPAEIMAIEGVDLVIGTQDRDKIMSFVDQIQDDRKPVNAVRNIMKTRDFEELDVPDFSDRTRAFLKIQEGCNNFCTFCIIPWSRGLSRSRDSHSVIEQAKQLVAAGYKEIVLTGIHTGGYGDDMENYNLTSLLWDLDKVEGLERIRISSIEASHVFPYSKRTGTPAARMEDQVDEEVKNERVHKLIDLSERMQLQYAETFVGEVLDVIPERDYKGAPGTGLIMGYTDNYIQVVFEGSESLVGKLCRVKITEAGVNECRATLVRVLDDEQAIMRESDVHSFVLERPEAIRA